MTKTKEEATLSFKEQLLKDWNSVKDDTGGYHNPRKKIRRDIEEIRQRVLTDYENYWSYGDELKKEDKKKEDYEKMNTYYSVFEWDEKYEVCYAFNLIPNDYYYQTVQCENYEDFREQITGEKTPDEVEEGNISFDDFDYESGFEVGEEEERTLNLDISNLRLKKPISARYIMRLDLEQVSSIVDKSGKSLEVEPEYFSKEITKLIHENLPHLLVRSSNNVKNSSEKYMK